MMGQKIDGLKSFKKSGSMVYRGGVYIRTYVCMPWGHTKAYGFLVGLPVQ